MAQPKYYTAPPHLWARLVLLAQVMRREPTEAEDRLWQRLRRKALGVRFRRQHPIGAYIVDFVCLQKRLIVEVDGPIHDCQVDHDENRDAYLVAAGFRVLRFASGRVMDNLEDVLKANVGEVGQ